MIDPAVSLDPSRAGDVASALIEYASTRFGASGVRFAEPPRQITHGWDTYLYTFRLEGDGLDAAWLRPLVIRIFATAEQLPRAETEVAIQRFIRGRGFPAPWPLALVGAESRFGRPFVIMERLPGGTMLDRVGSNPLRASRLFAAMADLHASLHQLDADGWPIADPGPQIERQLELMRADAGRFGRGEFDGPLRWLEEHKPAAIPDERSVCHNDYHPLNIVVSDDDQMAVVDWGSAAIGDRHLDVANTIALITLVPTGSISRFQRILAAVSRKAAGKRYLARYRACLPLDAERLRYWQAFVTVSWWLSFAGILAEGSAAFGLKPESTAYVRPEHLKTLRRHFEQLTRAAA